MAEYRPVPYTSLSGTSLDNLPKMNDAQQWLMQRQLQNMPSPGGARPPTFQFPPPAPPPAPNAPPNAAGAVDRISAPPLPKMTPYGADTLRGARESRGRTRGCDPRWWWPRRRGRRTGPRPRYALQIRSESAARALVRRTSRLRVVRRRARRHTTVLRGSVLRRDMSRLRLRPLRPRVVAGVMPPPA